MDKKNFTFWNRVVALAVFLIAAVTYLLTIEPTASFWDCGEFIASSYKLEVGHPPGNPVFQLFARFATIFTGPEHAAMAVNAMNAILSALTILLLYLTTVFLVKRLVKPGEDGNYSLAKSIVIFGSGAVGALAYTFSDTFWFSAVEGEVYAMSSLFTALVFWVMTKWYEQADEPYANRWLVLIALLMGLSIGIHLLNLLTIPALVFMFYYRKRGEKEYTMKQLIGIFGVSVVILAFILYGIIPYLPKIAAAFDLFFVNTLGLPFNTGAAFFMLALLGLCFWGLFETAKRKNALWNTILLCFTMIVIGFSIFTIVIIRSSAKTPTNEYQPDNPYTLVRYLGREQYGSNPLVYGQAFESPYTIEDSYYWAPMPGKNEFGEMKDQYIKAKGQGDIDYYSEGKMLFPRMWSSADGGYQSHVNFYKRYIEEPKYRTYTNENGRTRKFLMPSFGDNLEYFFDYQMNWMYWRYFMWNFAGRQNDIHGQSPNQFAGNWECGIDILDEPRLGDQSDAPGYLLENKGKNHYYMLPLLLGLIGLFFQYARDKRGSWVTFLMFFMTGIAIVIYLNQPPYQARERDYAYAGSFYAFSIWIGMAVAAIYTWVNEYCSSRCKQKSCEVITASAITAVALCVPVLMAAENWDDHDRSNRYTAVEMARNYLNSVGENGILITHGDNDTFPLWYAQEVEGIRTDVRIANTSLLGTDWHIDQMKWAMNDSAPLDLKLGPMKYLYGTNEYLYVHGEKPLTISEVISHINDDNRTLYHVMYSIPSLTYDEYGVFEDACFVASRKNVADISHDLINDEVFVSTSKEDIEEFLGRELKPEDIKITYKEELGAYVPTRTIKVPVNKANVIKSGILDEKFSDRILDEVVLTMSKDKNYITKPELFLLDLLSNYNWDRPINMLSLGGDLNIGQKDYLMYEGFSYKFVPVKNKMSSSEIGFSDAESLYYKMKNVYTWDALKRPDYFVDYHNYYTFCGVLSQRQLFVNVAKELIKAEEREKALEILNMCREYVPKENFPYEMVLYGFTNEAYVLEMIKLYYSLGERGVAEEMLYELAESLRVSADFFKKHESASEEYERVMDILSSIEEIYLDDVYELMVDEAKEQALANLDRAYSWVSVEELPTDACWFSFIMYYNYLDPSGDKAAKIARDYADALILELHSLVSTYDTVYSSYKSAYSRYQKTQKESDAQMAWEYKEMIQRLDDTIYELQVFMEQLQSRADDMGLTDVVDLLQEKLDLFNE